VFRILAPVVSEIAWWFVGFGCWRRKGTLTDMFDLGMLHDEFVHGDRGDVEKDPRNNHSDDPRNPFQDPEPSLELLVCIVLDIFA
jgi:hypothetical protein